jgi:hypothetical protein
MNPKCEKCLVSGDVPCPALPATCNLLASGHPMAESFARQQIDLMGRMMGGVRVATQAGGGIHAAIPSSPGGCGCGSPPLATQLATAAKAAGRFIASGFQFARRETQEARWETCKACDKRHTVKVCHGNPDVIGQDRCSACGCYLIMKLRLPHETCPLGKWGEESPPPSGGQSGKTGGPGLTS